MQQLIFIAVFCIVSFFAFKSYSRIYKTIRLGKEYNSGASTSERWKNLLLIAFGQKKMFKRWIPAFLHLCIYVAFVITQIELIEIMIDGFTGEHRIFAGKIGVLYPIIINTIEILSVLAFVATVIFLWRRNLLKLPRFVKPEMKGWPTLDANYILFGEIILILGIFTMNGADNVLQNLDPDHYPATGNLLVSSFVAASVFEGMSQSSLVILERIGWWMHILTVFAFLLYLPISKHLHILLAFPNVYFSDNKPRGEMSNMPVIMNEVKSMMGLAEEQASDPEEELPDFGVNDVLGLSWKNLLEAYTCTECGRCTSVCPANTTGKALSPRKIMMDIRDRADDVYKGIYEEGKEKSNYDDGRSLFDHITDEEIFACTTCNACVEACPVMINPLEPILELRRYKLLTESQGPSEWMPMFNAMENGGAVWQMPNERFDWAKEINNQ